MPTVPKLVLDTFCEVYKLLQPWADSEFWDLAQHDVQPDAVYVIGRQQCIQHKELLLSLVQNNHIQLVISNPHEGSQTLMGQLTRLGFRDTLLERKIKLIGGGDMPPEWPCLRYDKFLPEILDYEENIAAATHSESIYQKNNKPYDFLFLNGRRRPHRTQLIEKLNNTGVLERSLWTNLDAAAGQTRTLPADYEVARYSHSANPVSDNSYVKFDLFNNEWGEIYLTPAPYIDTYFSVVSETVFDIPYSFRTEKTWKPIVMGHPWIMVANSGFYRDLKNLGFQTYAHVIDENFDSIENNQDRLQRIADVIHDLCQQDLDSFLAECYNVSKYNQQHHRELAVQTRAQFPDRFFRFINE